MPILRNEYNQNSRGGTELSMEELERYAKPELLDKVQIIPSRFRALVGGLVPIYWIHDTENDPEMAHLANGGWQKFKKLVFVSNWQMQRFIEKFEIPWSRCVVIPNAIVPFEDKDFVNLETDETIRFIYHTTPHRGLNVLAAAFDELAKTEDVHLDVYSSFSIYGWTDRDAQFEPLYDRLRSNPKVSYHGAVSNEEIRKVLRHTHSFVYPCTWPETGCRSLMEAISAGAICATTNYGCLYETAHDLAHCYQFNENPGRLAGITLEVMREIVNNLRAGGFTKMNHFRSNTFKRARPVFSWEYRKHQWNQLLEEVIKDV